MFTSSTMASIKDKDKIGFLDAKESKIRLEMRRLNLLRKEQYKKALFK